MNKYTAIYVRRSVADKDNNSLSIDSQIADCIKFLDEGVEHKVYCDEGKSGKDIEHRPAFLQMMEDAKEGLIEQIIVKKYDRFSRNLKDYLNVSGELEKHGVGVQSLTEQFNTTTKEGRLMRNNLLSFAEFERETIAGRCKDSYDTRARTTGFRMGFAPYGYALERKTVNGKLGTVLVPSDKSHVIQKMYELYQNVNTSLRDVMCYFRDNGIETGVPRKARGNSSDRAYEVNGGLSNLSPSQLSKLLKNPTYVRANAEVYQYLISQGDEILDDIEAFDGVHGLKRHKKADGGYYIKVGYHEGLVDADVWLAVQDKKSHHTRLPHNTGAKVSWLTGLLRCHHCGYSFQIICVWNYAKTKKKKYFYDIGYRKANGCIQYRSKFKPDDVEEAVFAAMKKRLENMEIAKSQKAKPNTEIEAMKKEIIRIELEIDKWLDKLADESDEDAFTKRVKNKVNALDDKKSELEKKFHTLMRKSKAVDTEPLIDPISRWDSLSVEDKNKIAKTMIEVIYLCNESGIDVRFSV